MAFYQLCPATDRHKGMLNIWPWISIFGDPHLNCHVRTFGSLLEIFEEFKSSRFIKVGISSQKCCLILEGRQTLRSKRANGNHSCPFGWSHDQCVAATEEQMVLFLFPVWEAIKLSCQFLLLSLTKSGLSRHRSTSIPDKITAKAEPVISHTTTNAFFFLNNLHSDKTEFSQNRKKRYIHQRTDARLEIRIGKIYGSNVCSQSSFARSITWSRL